MKIFFICSVLLVTFCGAAQKKKTNDPAFYVFNEKGDPCKIDDATYMGVLEKLSDSTWEWKYYKFSGTLISIETYRDEQMTIPGGYFALFDNNGKIDSSGYVFEGKKDKFWLYYDDSIHVVLSEEYDKGVLKERKTPDQLKKQMLTAAVERNEKGEKEAAFTGGETGWRKFLEKNFTIPDRTLKLSINGTGMFAFTIETDGSLTDIRIVQSLEYSFDETMIRLLKQSPKWEPALKNNLPVKAYRHQPMTIKTDTF